MKLFFFILGYVITILTLYTVLQNCKEPKTEELTNNNANSITVYHWLVGKTSKSLDIRYKYNTLMGT